MLSAEIHRRFLDFFAERGHTVVPSASLIANDPTLLLVNAGMVPFKPYFLGEAPPPYPRATSVQKCVRTLDIEEVGKTSRHASFFQMCGNFSFGDYFKRDAIKYAWELLTTPQDQGGFGMSPDVLWVTVYLDDDEAYGIWRDEVGVAEDRIQRRGQADNFWSMGVPGPCGPCSEIFFDRGPQYGVDGGPVADEERYVEIWNLVFMQNIRGDGPGKEGYPILGELPAKNIDTGMGLERMATVLQGVENLYEIDTTMVILREAERLTGAKYGADEKNDIRLRVVADHARTATFLLADGVTPGNEGRGYVLRRMMRRVIRNMRLLGAEQPVMVDLVQASIRAMGESYPELHAESNRILQVSASEEQTFRETLRTGTVHFDVAAEKVRAAGKSEVSGSEAFLLHDTYGFPIDLTLEMASEAGLQVDEDGFRRLMAEQRDRAKADARSRKTGHTDLQQYRALIDISGPTAFTGYHETASESVVRGLLQDGALVQSAREGDSVEIVLDRSPMYAEGGGQLSDHGRFTLADGTVVEINDVQTPVADLWVHRARVISGEITVGASGVSAVDIERRRGISRAHTATHMVHKAFRELLGDTATQLGSENSPGRLRFDFPSPQAVPGTVLADVEARVNDMLLADLQVSAQQMSQPEAKALGAMALFGEKYGETVRVVSVGEWAHELCGGTHAQRSGQLGIVKILSEQSVGAGTRRVEALVGGDAYRFLAREHALVSSLTSILKGRPEELPEKVDALLTRLKDAEREIDRVRKQALASSAGDFAANGVEHGDVVVATFRAQDDLSGNDLREVALRARSALKPGRPSVVVGASVTGEKVALIALTNDESRAKGLSAKDALTAALSLVDGRGGGKDDVAQGAGSKPTELEAAFAAVNSYVSSRLGL
jgi:alanyl-tRNA synthetase